jgi:hypothetical protein
MHLFIIYSVTRSKRIEVHPLASDVCICFRSLIGVLLGLVSGSLIEMAEE